MSDTPRENNTSATEVSNPFRHFPVLDGLRGIAVLIVIVYHLEWLIPSLHPFVKGGFLGVDIFFVLSGFLITSILIKEHGQTNSIDLKAFYIRRCLRLIPAFWLFLIVLYLFGNQLLTLTQAKIIFGDENFLFAFFYLMNWHSASGIAGGNLNHTWSLAIEEQFYIIWSLALFKAFAESRSRKQIVTGTCIFVAILISQRGIRAFLGADIDILYYSTDTRIDALLIGCIASMVFSWQLVSPDFFRSRAFARITYIALIAAVSILMVFSHEDSLLYCGPISIFSASIATLILWFVTRQDTFVHKILEFQPLKWTGQISYGLYLWHYVFFEFAKKTFVPGYTQVFMGLLLGFTAASLSFYLLEKPILSIKNKMKTHQHPIPVTVTES